MNTKAIFTLSILLFAVFVTVDAARQLKSKEKKENNDEWFGNPWFPGGKNPWWDGSGMGGGYGGEWFKMAKNVTCTEKGKCKGKTLICPKKCFHSHSKKGKNSGSGSFAGSCSFDCEKCEATC